MKVEYAATPRALGHSFNTPYTGWHIRLHRQVYSVSNPKTRKGTWARGSGFLVHHQTDSFSSVTLPSYTYLGNRHGGSAAPVGYVSAQPTAPPASPTFSSESSYTTPWGTKGWARARPGNPVANAGQFIAELRQLPKIPLLDGARDRILQGGLKGLPGRLLSRLATFRRLGSEYLNIQFGWAPFVRDLQEMYMLTHDIDKRLDRLRRDNGRSLHRRRTLVDTTSTTATESVVNGPFAYLAPTPIIIGAGRTARMVQTISKEKIWFVGRFQYYVPNIGTLEWDRRARRALFGANITPKLVWDVLPWSWLVGYFSNAGDVFSNMSQNAVDNTVAKYAYVMRTSSSETTTVVQTSWGARSGSPATYPAGSGIAIHRSFRETKSRVSATPFGFGMTWNGLSAFQASILGALGMSRSRF